MAVPDSAALLGCNYKREFVPEKVVKPVRIFLSHGNEPNEELVRCIQADWEQRGQVVWFERTGIKAGDDWRRSITDGILQNRRFVPRRWNRFTDLKQKG